MNVYVCHNTVSSRFEVNISSGLCELYYETIGTDILDFKKTYVPENARNRGIGSKMVKEALAYAKMEQYLVKFSCPFFKKVVEENMDEYGDLAIWTE